MGDVTERRPTPDWRPSLAIGLAVGLAMGISRVVEKALAPQVGAWGAFGVSLAAAAVAAAVVGLFVYAVVRKR